MADTASVRPPKPSDGAILAMLAGELGYPTDTEAMLGRLASLSPTNAAVMVATDANAQVALGTDVAPA